MASVDHNNPRRGGRRAGLTAAAVVASFPTAAAGQSCDPMWDTAFGQPGIDAHVFALAVFDDGSGPALYAGGRFEAAGGAPASRIARWDGTSWSEVGGGINGEVYALAALDIGSGPALLAGGVLVTAGGVPVNNIARWDGGSWSPLGSGLEVVVYDLVVFDDGAGPVLHAATDIPSAQAGGVWRFDGGDWSLVGGGLSFNGSGAEVRALAVFDDGTGPALYAGGLFNDAGGVPVSSLAKWDGASWHDVGGGLNENVHDLLVFDDGGGPALYVGGTFLQAGAVPAIGLARWTGTSWENLGNDDFIEDFPGIFAMAVFDDGAGSALYASGVNSFQPNRLYRWDGSELLIATEHGGSWVRALASFDDGDGPALYMAGQFLTIEDAPAKNIARWVACEATVPGDLDGDGVVGVSDLLVLLGAWGPCPEPCPPICDSDIDGDCQVGAADLLVLLGNWSNTAGAN